MAVILKKFYVIQVDQSKKNDFVENWDSNEKTGEVLKFPRWQNKTLWNIPLNPNFDSDFGNGQQIDW